MIEYIFYAIALSLLYMIATSLRGIENTINKDYVDLEFHNHDPDI